jgi:tRNA pseudouridine55 synthase
VVARVRRILGGAKVGHAGTLDPDATGVLVICVGKATKISAFLMEGEKVYRGVGRLGVSTETQDASGAVVAECSVDLDEGEVREAAARFVGDITQVPPMYSALKVGGRKLYRLARAGVEVERVARPVTVHELEILDVALPEFTFEVRCSKGTYVRTLVHDLGEALGCGGHLAGLSRERQGNFTREAALPWSAVEGADAADRIRRAVVTPEEALAFLDDLAVPAAAHPLRLGGLVPAASLPEGAGGIVRLTAGGAPIGVGRRSDEGLRPMFLFPSPPRFGRSQRAT